ncbi:MAG: SusE domain-containing protein [Bacteroidota bacterium]|nr:SusE domain-containing protein [Bacteroidota bacterium]
MKKVTIILMAILGVIYFQSCEKDKEGPFLSDTLTGPVLRSALAGDSEVLLEENEDDIIAFTWTKADYGFKAAATYFLQMDLAGNNFAEYKNLGHTNGQRIAHTVGDINGILMAMDATPEEPVDLEARIMAVLHEEIDTIYSNVISFTLTPFEKVIIYPRLFVPGDHNGWNAGDSSSVIWSAGFNDRYEGYIYTYDNPSYFKLLKVPAWEEDNTIGDPDPSGTSGTLQIGSWGGNNIMINTDPGLHRIKADLGTATYSILRTEWGIIGGAVPPYDWSVDVDMTYNDTDDVLEVTLDLQAGDLKFRANDDWALNYGDDEPDGIVEAGGSNIPIPEAGNYTITLDLSQAIYTYTIVKN